MWDPATGVNIMLVSSMEGIKNLPEDVRYKVLYGRKMYVERGGYLSGSSVVVKSDGGFVVVQATSNYEGDYITDPIFLNDYWGMVFRAIDQLKVARGIGRYEPKDAFYNSVNDFSYKPSMWGGIEQPNN